MKNKKQDGTAWEQLTEWTDWRYAVYLVARVCDDHRDKGYPRVAPNGEGRACREADFGSRLHQCGLLGSPGREVTASTTWATKEPRHGRAAGFFRFVPQIVPHLICPESYRKKIVPHQNLLNPLENKAILKSGIRESNSFHSLGKAGHGRYTNPAFLRV